MLSVVVVTICMKILKILDENEYTILNKGCSDKTVYQTLIISLINEILLYLCMYGNVNSIRILILGEIVFGGLIFAARTDKEFMHVYDFTWWIILFAEMFLFVGGGLTIAKMASIIIYIALQYAVFLNFYGKADCIAFCVCAVMGGFIGLGIYDFFLHMAISFTILTIVQALKGNVESGRLIKCVGFLPYITVSFDICMLLHLIKNNLIIDFFV